MFVGMRWGLRPKQNRQAPVGFWHRRLRFQPEQNPTPAPTPTQTSTTSPSLLTPNPEPSPGSRHYGPWQLRARRLSTRPHPPGKGVQHGLVMARHATALGVAGHAVALNVAQHVVALVSMLPGSKVHDVPQHMAPGHRQTFNSRDVAMFRDMSQCSGTCHISRSTARLVARSGYHVWHGSSVQESKNHGLRPSNKPVPGSCHPLPETCGPGQNHRGNKPQSTASQPWAGPVLSPRQPRQLL